MELREYRTVMGRKMKDMPQLARRQGDQSQLYLVATGENVSSLDQRAPRVVRMNPDDSFEKKLWRVLSVISTVRGVNAYEVGEGKTVVDNYLPPGSRDYALTPHFICPSQAQRALEAENREELS